MSKLEQSDIVWVFIPWANGFNDGDRVWLRSERGDVWRGHYSSFECHKNSMGDYPVDVAHRDEA